MAVINFVKIRNEENYELREMFQGAFVDCMHEVKIRDSILTIRQQLIGLQAAQLATDKEIISMLMQDVKEANKSTLKQRRRTLFAWITGGVVSGLLVGLLVSK